MSVLKKFWFKALAPALAATMVAASAGGAAGSSTPISTIEWKNCPLWMGGECASIDVPVDWSDPSGPTVKMAMSRLRASNPAARIGTMLFNPGGPGGTGVSAVSKARISAELRSRFDFIGFDPRGVGASEPQVKCSAALLQRKLPAVPLTEEQFQERLAYNHDLGESCRQHTGDLIDHLDAKSVARDLEAVRVALGEEKISYFGISYGTLFGQMYAELFPAHVRAMYLDGVVDHQLATYPFMRTGTVNSEDSFSEFVAWCDRSSDCALHGRKVPEVFENVYQQYERGGISPELTGFDLLATVQGLFYEPSWASVAGLLASHADAAPGPAARASAASDHPQANVEVPIFCTDWQLPVEDFNSYEALRQELANAAPHMRMPAHFWHVFIGCLNWPATTGNPQHWVSATGAPPILLVNSRHDVSTGHVWAEGVSRQLIGSQLLTYEGSGHNVYPISHCAAEAADKYLIDLILPAPGVTCPISQ